MLGNAIIKLPLICSSVMPTLSVLKKVPVSIEKEIAKLNLLWPGSRGNAVTSFQTVLNNLGYSQQINGSFDHETEKTVKAIQKQNGLQATGIADSTFYCALRNPLKAPVKKGSLKNNAETGDFVIQSLTDNIPGKPTVKKTSPKNNVFVSYSHKDKKWMDRLRVFITPIEREGYVNVWDDTRIKTGNDWKAEIKAAIQAARAAVLLLSADFMASQFITDNELPPLLNKSGTKGLKIIPVIISPCILGGLSKYQSVNPPDKPMVDMKRGDRERTWVKVVEDLTDALN